MTTQSTSKRCFKCDAVKPRSDFYKHSKMADGLLGKCKECTKADAKANYVREGSLEKRTQYLKKHMAKPEVRARILKNSRSARKRHPEKYRARTAVGNAIRDGILKRLPCSSCGSSVNVEAHHHDYSKPLDVEWMCHRCHRRAHGRLLEVGPTS